MEELDESVVGQENEREGQGELRWMCGVTHLDKIRNERIRGTPQVGELAKKVQEGRSKLYGLMMRREVHYVGRRAMEMKVRGRRKRGRTKRRWLDKVKDGIKEKGRDCGLMKCTTVLHGVFIVPNIQVGIG